MREKRTKQICHDYISYCVISELFQEGQHKPTSLHAIRTSKNTDTIRKNGKTKVIHSCLNED